MNTLGEKIINREWIRILDTRTDSLFIHLQVKRLFRMKRPEFFYQGNLSDILSPLLWERTDETSSSLVSIPQPTPLSALRRVSIGRWLVDHFCSLWSDSIDVSTNFLLITFNTFNTNVTLLVLTFILYWKMLTLNKYFGIFTVGWDSKAKLRKNPTLVYQYIDIDIVAIWESALQLAGRVSLYTTSRWTTALCSE